MEDDGSHITKRCAYCGRENDGASLHCIECGTELVDSVSDQPSAPQARNWGWLKYALTYCGGALGVASLYLLSFGPVSRYCATVTSTSPSTTTIANSTVVMTTTRTVQYPKWVYFMYSPAFSLNRGSGCGIYGRYLEWWENGSKQK